MREILFRGKRIDNGEWAYGVYYKQEFFYRGEEELHCIIPTKEALSNDLDLGYESVIPETVGQYTGLKDKNGKKIFEGDIVDVVYDIRHIVVSAISLGRFEVVFHDGCFMKKNQDGLSFFSPSDKCTVVGNIHEAQK